MVVAAVTGRVRAMEEGEMQTYIVVNDSSSPTFYGSRHQQNKDCKFNNKKKKLIQNNTYFTTFNEGMRKKKINK